MTNEMDRTVHPADIEIPHRACVNFSVLKPSPIELVCVFCGPTEILTGRSSSEGNSNPQIKVPDLASAKDDRTRPPRARSEAKASKTETAKMTPSARNANKRKAESSPENGGDASTTTAANPSRPQRKKQKQQADESTSPAASPVAGNHGGVSSAPTGMKKHMLSLLNELQTAVDETYPPLASNTRVHLVLM